MQIVDNRGLALRLRHPEKVTAAIPNSRLVSDSAYNVLVKWGVVEKNIELFKEAMADFCEGLPRIFTCSSKTGKGRGEILNFIEQALSMR